MLIQNLGGQTKSIMVFSEVADVFSAVTGIYGLSSLSEKTRVSNHLQM